MREDEHWEPLAPNCRDTKTLNKNAKSLVATENAVTTATDLKILFLFVIIRKNHILTGEEFVGAVQTDHFFFSCSRPFCDGFRRVERSCDAGFSVEFRRDKTFPLKEKRIIVQ